MADDSTVTIRHKSTGAERTVEKSAVAFFPDYDVLTKDGRVNPKATTTTTAKD
jgi:hypothetical protein